jgi:hypothetical protein
MVKLKIAEAMKGKPIMLIPGGENGLGINKLDLTKMMESAYVAEAKD